MEVWNAEALTTTDMGETATSKNGGKSRGWLLAAASRLRNRAPAPAARWEKAIRALHAECDRLKRKMERAR